MLSIRARPSFRDVLRNDVNSMDSQYTFESFAHFCQSRQVTESIRFIQSVKRMMLHVRNCRLASTRRAMVQRIVQRFISSGSMHEINIGCTVRKATIANCEAYVSQDDKALILDESYETLFSDALLEVIKLLRADVWPQYIRSLSEHSKQ